MKILKRVSIIVTIVLFTFYSNFNTAYAAVSEESFSASTRQDIYQKYYKKTEHLQSINGVSYEYSSDKRIAKITPNASVIYSYNTKGKLIKESGLYEIEYLYDDNELYGFSIKEKVYKYIFDEGGIIVGIVDQRGNQVCRYEYNDTMPITYQLDEGRWLVNNESGFIGNINPFRYTSWYFDAENSIYYLGEGFYYSCNEGEFLFNRPILNESLLSSEPVVIRQIVQAYDMYMYSQTFGAGAYVNPTQESWINGARWYDGINQVEVIARCIYAENTDDTLAGKNNRIAETAVIMNRIDTLMDSTAYNAVTRRAQFSSINPDTYNEINSNTYYARQIMDKTKECYKQAIMLACTCYYTYSLTDLNSIYLIPSYINTQTHFLSFRYVCNNNLFYVSEGDLYYDGSKIHNVALPGTIQITPTNLSTVISNYRTAGHNVFFEY